MRLLSIFFFLLPCACSLNILMYLNVAGKSHVQFAEKLIALLNERGHSVDLIMGRLNSHFALKGSYGARKAVTVEFPGESPWGKVASHINHPFLELFRFDMNTNAFAFLTTCEQLCDLLVDSSEVEDLLTANKYDLALISGYDLCPFALAYHYKIKPVVSYVPTAVYSTQSYYAGIPELPLYEHIVFDASHDDRSASFSLRIVETLRTFRERYATYLHYTTMNEKVRARFGADFPDVREIAMNTSLDFTNTHPLLEEPRPISLRLKYIGGVGLPQPKPLNRLDDELNLSAKGNVIFSFGTQIPPEKISMELRTIFINTFKRFPDHNFLWKFDGTTQFNASNIFNMNWLPQTDLLYDSRVVAFISHMGLNSFTETAYAGVPVVAIPLFADQLHNAKRVQALGVGVIVRKTEITEENLSNALRKVLFDEKYRLRAREVSAMMTSSPDTPQRTFLEGIEFAAKFENLSTHYRLVGARHHVLVQMGWDVAAFFTIVVLFSLYTTSLFVVFVLRKMSKAVLGKRKFD